MILRNGMHYFFCLKFKLEKKVAKPVFLTYTVQRNSIKLNFKLSQMLNKTKYKGNFFGIQSFRFTFAQNFFID